jgi:hypothetical protein
MKKKKLLSIFTSLPFLITVIIPNHVFALDSAPQKKELYNFKGLTKNTMDAVNPLKLANGGDGSQYAEKFSNPGGILSQVLFFAFPLAGIILFVMIIWGGFEMLGEAATKKTMDAGRQRVKYALLGFILLFISYWLVAVIETVFSIAIF